ncbi:MAG: hypothetical protein ACE5DK_12515 [Paracoccaceae bacterium]
MVSDVLSILRRAPERVFHDLIGALALFFCLLFVLGLLPYS